MAIYAAVKDKTKEVVLSSIATSPEAALKKAINRREKPGQTQDEALASKGMTIKLVEVKVIQS